MSTIETYSSKTPDIFNVVKRYADSIKNHNPLPSIKLTRSSKPNSQGVKPVLMAVSGPDKSFLFQEPINNGITDSSFVLKEVINPGHPRYPSDIETDGRRVLLETIYTVPRGSGEITAGNIRARVSTLLEPVKESPFARTGRSESTSIDVGNKELKDLADLIVNMVTTYEANKELIPKDILESEEAK